MGRKNIQPNVPWALVTLFVALFTVAIPWYWSWLPIDERALWLGMPAWFVVAIAASFLISAVASWRLSRRWHQELDDPSEETQ